MLTREEEQRFRLAEVIAFASAYEFLAICTGRVPTISRITWTIYRKRWGKPVVWLILGWLTDHLLVAPEE